MPKRRRTKMKKVVMLVMALALFALIGNASAVPSGKTVEFAGDKSPGKVIFDGKVHADKGFKCKDCHTDIFKMKKGSVTITKADHEAGKLCFSCHNGTKAFAAKENCTKCHKK
jgi:c(7)-type cytochrome triheme protein